MLCIIVIIIIMSIKSPLDLFLEMIQGRYTRLYRIEKIFLVMKSGIFDASLSHTDSERNDCSTDAAARSEKFREPLVGASMPPISSVKA